MKKPLLKKTDWLAAFQAGLALAALIIMSFELMHYVHDESIVSLTGYNLLFGKFIDSEAYLVVNANYWLILFTLVFAFVNFLNLFEIKGFQKYLNIGKAFINGGAFVAAYGMMHTFYVAREMHSDAELTLTFVGKLFILVLLALFLLSLFELAKSLKLDDFGKRVAKYVKVGLCAFMLCGLFAPLFKISNASNVISLTGIELMFGKTFEETVLSYKEIPGNLVTIFAFASVLVILAINVVGLFIELDVLKKFALVLSVFVFYYFVNLEAGNTMTIVSSHHRGVTTFGSLVSLAGVGLFVTTVIEFIKLDDLNNNLKLLAFVCVILAATSIYLPSYHLYTNYGNETNYNNAYVSISSVLLGEKAGGYSVHPLMIYLSYVSVIGAAVLSVVKFNMTKLKYFASFALCLAGILFFVLFNDGVFHWLEHSTYNHVDFYQNGFVYIVMLAIPALIYLYISATEPSSLVDDSEYKAQPTSKKHK